MDSSTQLSHHKQHELENTHRAWSTAQPPPLLILESTLPVLFELASRFEWTEADPAENEAKNPEPGTQKSKILRTDLPLSLL